jgi:hypothetical protein
MGWADDELRNAEGVFFHFNAAKRKKSLQKCNANATKKFALHLRFM